MNIVVVSKPTEHLKFLKKLTKNWDNIYFITDNEVLDNKLKEYNPDWVFFYHWSHIVPSNIYSKYRCVTLHVGILPQHRGGSPIQNQIMDGITFTNVNALVMQEPLDSGDIYCKERISLQGSLNDIWTTLTHSAYNLINKCISENPTPSPQQGDAQCFFKTYKRKTDNSLVLKNDIKFIYDQIRMLDGDGYPNTYLELNGFKLEFSRAKSTNSYVLADVKISKV